MRQWLDWPAIESFDRWLAAHVAPCDVFHCLSSFGLRGHRTANSRYGAVTVCDRGSSHIVYQDEVLAEEYERHRTAYRPINPRVVEKELQEYEECDLITVPSSFVLRTFVAKGVPENKLAKLSYGVDLRLFRPVPKEDAVFRAVYAGSLMLQKGVPYLLDALATLRLPDFDLLLIGGMTEEIRPFLARHAGGFHYAGFIHRTELFRWFSQGSVFVIASIQEGLALVMAQAMACGLPVIATTNTGAEDLITDGVEGFIVPPRDPQAIREKVLLLYEQPELRAEMGQAALRRVKCLGGWDQYGDRAAHVYADAIARKHGSRIA
jgi:glycosyltransferase involved in cell wall biosynthesis